MGDEVLRLKDLEEFAKRTAPGIWNRVQRGEPEPTMEEGLVMLKDSFPELYATVFEKEVPKADAIEEFYIIIDRKRYFAASVQRDFDGERIVLFLAEFREHRWSWKRKKLRFRYDEMDVNWTTGECTIKEVE